MCIRTRTSLVFVCVCVWDCHLEIVFILIHDGEMLV